MTVEIIEPGFFCLWALFVFSTWLGFKVIQAQAYMIKISIYSEKAAHQLDSGPT